MDSQVSKKTFPTTFKKLCLQGWQALKKSATKRYFVWNPRVDAWFLINMGKRHNEIASLLILIVLYLQKHSLLEIPLVGKRHIKSCPTQNKTAYCRCSATCAFPVFPHPLFFITLRCLRGSKLPKGAMFLAFHGRLPLN